MGEVKVEQRGNVLLATLDNPPHALMDEPIVDGLEKLVARAAVDDGVGAVVITGSHPQRFIAHYNIAELLEGARSGPSVGPRTASASLRAVGALRRIPSAGQALTRTPAAGLVALERFHEIFLSMNRSGAVFVAALNGSALGGGCELSLACDVRLMAAGDHSIGQPEILLGFPPGGGGTQRLARLLGTARALRLVLEGGPLSPDEAAEIGLVDEVVGPGELIDRALALAHRLGSRPKAAVAASKRAVYQGGSMSLADGLRLERAEFLATIGSEESKQAMAAYLEGFEQTGELPAYDQAARERALEAGRFGP